MIFTTFSYNNFKILLAVKSHKYLGTASVTTNGFSRLQSFFLNSFKRKYLINHNNKLATNKYT